MAGRVYVATFENVNVTAAQDFFAILPAANKDCILHEVTLSVNDDPKDAEEEQLRVEIIRGHTVAGSGGGTTTPVAYNTFNNTVCSATVRINDTTIASSGTAVVLHAESFNNRIGFSYRPPVFDDERATWQNAEYLVVRLMAAPTSTAPSDAGAHIAGTLKFAETD